MPLGEMCELLRFLVTLAAVAWGAFQVGRLHEFKSRQHRQKAAKKWLRGELEDRRREAAQAIERR